MFKKQLQNNLVHLNLHLCIWGMTTKKKNFSINHDNIFFWGFVNIVNTDSEDDIPSKIGDAIRLKYPLIGERFFVSLCNPAKVKHTC